jgi:hypothetical protein
MRLRRAGGEGGSVGYLRWLAHEHPPAFAGLVGKVLAGKLLGTAKSCEAALVLNVLHKHPQLTLAEALSHLWFFGRFVIGPTAILDLPARALIR